MEAYACIEQDGYSASFIYRPPIYDGPLALNASVGYKFVSGIEGMDRFGKMCAEVKSSLIDLEFLIAA